MFYCKARKAILEFIDEECIREYADCETCPACVEFDEEELNVTQYIIELN